MWRECRSRHELMLSTEMCLFRVRTFSGADRGNFLGRLRSRDKNGCRRCVSEWKGFEGRWQVVDRRPTPAPQGWILYSCSARKSRQTRWSIRALCCRCHVDMACSLHRLFIKLACVGITWSLVAVLLYVVYTILSPYTSGNCEPFRSLAVLIISTHSFLTRSIFNRTNVGCKRLLPREKSII